jgi:Zn-dependent protease with chaperone function
MNNFHEHQDRARTLSRRLFVFWVLATICLTAVTVGIIEGIFLTYFHWNAGNPYLPSSEAHGALSIQSINWLRVVLAATAMLAGVGLMGALKWQQLRQGGAWVAQKMGGVPLEPATAQDHAERRALSIIKEMSLASNTPMPKVFVLREDLTINAFAAGLTLDDAVIGLTRGAIEQLDREQLQGVVAHEFSHIVNGDMRLNMRLVVVIAGLAFIHLMGRALVELAPGSDKRMGAPLLAAGASLMALGFMGIILSSIVRAAISRQREYLADACAVQYTRNPKGIAGALSKIEKAGSTLSHPDAAQFQHMMFGQSVKANWLATHPPLRKRIARLGF